MQYTQEVYIELLQKVQIPMALTESTMKNSHQYAINYLTHLVFHKRKLDNKQGTTTPTYKGPPTVRYPVNPIMHQGDS